MKRLALIFSFLSVVLIQFSVYSQTIITLQPGPDEAKDAKVWSNEPTTNFGADVELKANAWTWDGDPGNERAFFQFDLSDLPQDAELCYAKLSLYKSIGSTQTNSTLSGSNESYIRRITSDWEEDLVTWNTQPSNTTVNQVTLPASIEDYEDITDIDVTELVQDMIEYPANSFGFMLLLEDEDYYRRRVFASSDATATSNFPELEICYTEEVPVNTIETSAKVDIYPNPVDDLLNIDIDLSGPSDCDISIRDITGQFIYHLYSKHLQQGTNKLQFHTDNLIPISGFMILTVKTNEWIFEQKVICY